MTMFHNITVADRELKRDAEYWRDRAEDLERRQREAEQERADRRDRERRETRERLREAMHEADNWPDAFSKQRALLQKEIDFCATEKAQCEAGNYPPDSGQACDPAWWQKGIDELKQSMAAVDKAESLLVAGVQHAKAAYEAAMEKALASAATAIEAEFPKDGQCLGEHLRRNDPAGLLNW
jgi:hypothetical protein